MLVCAALARIKTSLALLLFSKNLLTYCKMIKMIYFYFLSVSIIYKDTSLIVTYCIIVRLRKVLTSKNSTNTLVPFY